MWQSVELRELRLYLALAEELHFGRTATKLGLTQSRVSQSLADLERKLGVTLVHRTSRRVRLTPEGARFRVDAEQALIALDDILRATQEAAVQLRAPLRLGVVTPGQVGHRLRSIIADYEAAHPHSQVQFVGLPFTDRFGPLRRGDVDVMITSLPLRQRDLATGPVLTRQPRLLAVARQHPLAQRSEISIEEVADYRVGNLDIAGPPELLQEMSPLHTPQGRPILRSERALRDPAELLLAVAAGQIVQPVLAAFAATYQHPEIMYLPITDLPPARTVLAWRRDTRSRALQELLRLTTAGLKTARVRGARGLTDPSIEPVD